MIKKLIKTLKSVPAKQFAIMELAPQLIGKDGKVDVAKAIDRQAELNIAITEVQVYVRSVKNLNRRLRYLGDFPTKSELMRMEQEEHGARVREINNWNDLTGALE